jgi:hypothetical protein
VSRKEEEEEEEGEEEESVTVGVSGTIYFLTLVISPYY